MKTKYTIPKYILALKNTRLLHFIIDLGFIYIVTLIIYFLTAVYTYLFPNF